MTSRELSSFAKTSAEINTDNINAIASEQWEQANSKKLLTSKDLGQLNLKSDRKGFLQLAGHLGVLGASGWLWGNYQGGNYQMAIAILALFVYGFSLASMFATVHECVHRTAFAHVKINDIVAWWAGVLSFYNSTFYRRYHKWHHRYTQIPGKDPELNDPKPTTLGEYLREILGWNWWLGKIRGHWQIALGNLENHPYIAPNAHGEVIRSTRLQLLVYGIAIALSVAVRQPWFVIYWLLPLMIGQPLLRAILLAEHTGCSYDNNILTNTRTTLTLAPLRFLMWNMPYHAEHHAYPSLPFHALAPAHLKLGSYFARVEPGYFYVNRQIIAQFGVESGQGK
jgi:fatty acid desaturase